MDHPPPPPSAPPTSPHSHQPLPSTTTTKLRLMCSYGGHIIPRPHNKYLFYAGGETRIVALDRRTTASSLSALTSHLSRTLFHNRPFNLKYQLPNEDLDSLISVTTDEDLFNMIEEHDRINHSSPMPARIRLFLFPVKPESLGSSLLDPKSESWFSDALKSTRILQKGESADTGLLMDLGLVGGSDLEGQVEIGSNSGGGGFESKHGAESLVLETSSSFGSTSSSISMSNLPPIGVVHCDENGLNLQDKKIRVPSSASIESDNSIGSAAYQPKTGMFQEPLIQVSSGTLLNPIESESIISGLPSTIETQQTIQILGHSLSQQLDEKQFQPEMQYIHGAVRYIPQYPTTPSPIPPYYPVYQIPTQQQQQQHMTYPPNQSYPIYLVPARPTQYHNMSPQYSFIDTASSALSRPPLHPTQPVAHREVLAAEHVAESSTKICISGRAAAPPVSISSSQGQQLIGPPEPQNPSESVTTASVATITHGNEFEDDIAYNSIYKTQPPAPVLPPQYQTLTKGASVLFSESSVQLQPNTARHQSALHTQ
ncbi:uncharacterized protein Fot_26112 [Forsythia ovata]|uniref:PB1 domain-containing protein n=1 Tax=Forsythia ovata TaxID=205694 RepID=A0ABD1UAZ4_9LAMI